MLLETMFATVFSFFDICRLHFYFVSQKKNKKYIFKPTVLCCIGSCNERAELLSKKENNVRICSVGVGQKSTTKT